MEMMLLLKAAAALVFTLLLIGGVAFALKRISHRMQRSNGFGRGALTLVEVLPLDMRHKLAIAGYGDKQYVLLLGHQVQPQIVDIVAKPKKKPPATQDGTVV
jgi:flagellar biogenesis protein FliO